jgi:hypothetical protein
MAVGSGFGGGADRGCTDAAAETGFDREGSRFV